MHFQNETNISWPYFWMIFFRVIITGIKVVTKFPCPRTLRLDVTWQEVLVWCWGQRERVKLLSSKRSARETDPLSRQVFEVRWAVELDLNDVWRQKFCFHDVERHVLCAKTYHLKRWRKLFDGNWKLWRFHHDVLVLNHSPNLKYLTHFWSHPDCFRPAN